MIYLNERKPCVHRVYLHKKLSVEPMVKDQIQPDIDLRIGSRPFTNYAGPNLIFDITHIWRDKIIDLSINQDKHRSTTYSYYK